MNRAQYLQTRNTLRLMAELARSLPLDDAVATIDKALADGPQKAAAMWADGRPDLVATLALAQAFRAVPR